MSSALHNLSEHSTVGIGNVAQCTFAVVVAEWNPEITEALYEATHRTLLQHGVRPENITRHNVPGSYELTLAAHWLAAQSQNDAVICLGCVIQGETRHFDFICGAVAQGLTQVALQANKPVIFGVLTPNNQAQALDRAGGKHGNKGDEAALAALKMVTLHQQLFSIS